MGREIGVDAIGAFGAGFIFYYGIDKTPHSARGYDSLTVSLFPVADYACKRKCVNLNFVHECATIFVRASRINSVRFGFDSRTQFCWVAVSPVALSRTVIFSPLTMSGRRTWSIQIGFALEIGKHCDAQLVIARRPLQRHIIIIRELRFLNQLFLRNRSSNSELERTDLFSAFTVCIQRSWPHLIATK